MVTVAVAFFGAILSLVWTPYDPEAIEVTARLAGPSVAHILGTDSLGRDMVSQLLVGLRYSMVASVASMLLGLLPGAVLGLFAAFIGGPSDAWSMRAVDILFAFPAILTAILLTAIYGPGVQNAIAAIALFNFAVFARVTRGAALTIIHQPYVLAARALGIRTRHIILRHVLPNMAGVLIVQATIQLSVGILGEAGLSFLGLGVQPPAPSLGKMLAQAQTMVFLSPMQAVYPGAIIFLVVIAFNMVGDSLRDALDPTLTRQRVRVPASSSAVTE